MAVGFSNTNKPLNPRGQDASPKGYNRASLFSGKALDFDGANDSVDLDGFTMAGTTATFVFNVNFDAITINQFVFDLKPVRFVIGLSDITGNPFGLFDNSQWQSFGDLEPNQWYNISISIDGTSAKMYLNGQSFGNEMTMANAIDFDSATEVGVGSNFSKGGGFVNGQIAGFKIFNTALTAAQVADLYNNPEKVVPTGVDNTALKLWLPMMEGAGTTAYDGSGNGNHGTIAGATYVNGIGAPVAQSAVIDWNKLYDFDGVDDQAYNVSYQEVTGTKTYKVHFNSHDVTQQDQQVVQFFNNSAQSGFGTTIAPFGGNDSKLGFRVVFNSITGTQLSWDIENNTFYELVFTIDWDAQSVSNVTLNGESATGALAARVANPSFGLYLGARSTAMYLNGIVNYFEVVGEDKWTNASGFKSESGSYDMTIDGSPTQILAPQGLTTGRDITGVNLFENVRKQGALNLDGKSWAEVHDNESLDFGTGSFTLEAWAKADFLSQGSGANIIFSLGGDITSSNNSGLTTSTTAFSFWIGGVNVSTPAYVSESWNHIVGVRSGSSVIFYFNGAQVATGSSSSSITNEQTKRIGRDTSIQRYYPNQIAQPRIYNRALTASEVLRNYNSGKNTYTND